jgi:hypothetical protein
MANYNDKLRELTAREEALERQMSGIGLDLANVQYLLRELEKERLASIPNELSEEEEKWLRDEITVVGKVLESKDVIFGGLTLVDEEPEKENTRGYFGPDHCDKFSIDIRMGICTEFQAALSCAVTIKTKNATVERIVREMVRQEDDYDKEFPHRRTWKIDWDFHDRIVIRNPYVHKDDE